MPFRQLTAISDSTEARYMNPQCFTFDYTLTLHFPFNFVDGKYQHEISNSRTDFRTIVEVSVAGFALRG